MRCNLQFKTDDLASDLCMDNTFSKCRIPGQMPVYSDFLHISHKGLALWFKQLSTTLGKVNLALGFCEASQ